MSRANKEWVAELTEILQSYNHAVFMERWKQADYWWKALKRFSEAPPKPKTTKPLRAKT